MSMRNAQGSENTTWTVVFLCWLLASVATLGSLFFSEVMDLAPCSLCWYQRIFIFPLVFLFAVGLYPPDRNVARYALPLVVAGWFVAGYQNLLILGIVPESVSPCQMGVSCTEIDFALFGFLTIPLLSWLVFTALLGMLLYLLRRTAE